VPGYVGPLTVEQFKGGQSNPTYKLVTPHGKYVMRRKPPGQLLKGAHAVDREAQVLRVLRTVGFPVARVDGLCTDDRVIGTWFYVMDYVDGRTLLLASDASRYMTGSIIAIDGRHLVSTL
jgi:aminoglycoside phosphotransferase (APT) family kinase protein